MQGKFNMGGTGVLQFTGVHSFQLILSKRRSDIPPFDGDNPLRHHWGFTLTRRLPPSANQPHSMYVYLTPGGEVPSFEADTLPLLPGRYPDAHSEEMPSGTCIKLWNYKLPRALRTLATLDLRFALEHHLQDPALPLRVRERRTGYRAHYFDTTVSGLDTVLADSKDDIEPGMDTGGSIGVPDVGPVDVRVVVVKEDTKKSKKYPTGVFFNVNGQLHSKLGSDFISRKTRLEYIARSMLVMVDCSHLPQLVVEDLFMASRDRMRQCDERQALETAVATFLRDHPGLRELNARRRQERLSSAAVQDDAAVVLQRLLNADPTLAALMGKGSKVKAHTGDIPEPQKYEGREFPTYFRIMKEPKDGLVKHCPRNRTCIVPFETNANNNYFSRTKDPGHLEVQGNVGLVSSNLWKGKANLRLAPPGSASPGDVLKVRVKVSDVNKVAPLESELTMKVEADAPPSPPGAPSQPSRSGLKGVPPLVEVYRDKWGLYDFNDHSALLLRLGEDETLDVFVNMDNVHLKNEVARRRGEDPKLLGYWYKYGLYLLGLGMFHRERETAENLEAVDTERISKASEGLAVTVIPVIAQLSKGRVTAEPGDA